MERHPSDVAAMNEAWGFWFVKHAPRNEEAFYTCFKDAWNEAKQFYERKVPPIYTSDAQILMLRNEIEALEQKLRDARKP